MENPGQLSVQINTLKEETLMAMAADEIAQYEQEALAAAQEENANLTLEMMDDEEAMKKVRSPTAKQLVKARNQIIAKIKKQALQASKEGAVTFEELGVDMIITDECFTFNTVVLTDRGPMPIGEIVENKIPVRVASFNHATGNVEWKKVTRWYRHARRVPLVEVFHEQGSFVCTVNHNIYVEGHGYKRAAEIGPTDRLIISDAQWSEYASAKGARYSDVRMVRDGVFASGVEGEALLQRVLQNALAKKQSVIGDQVAGVDGVDMGQHANQGAAEPEVLSVHHSEPAHEQPGGQGKGFGDSTSDRAQTREARGERAFDRAANLADAENRTSAGVGNQHSADTGVDGGSSEPLQSGSGLHGVAAGRGSRREGALHNGGAGAGREEGRGVASTRVVGLALLEPGSDGEYSFGGRDHSVVYDIEVEDNHNFFANGALVSNSHEFKKPPVATRMTVRGLQKQVSSRSLQLRFLTDFVKGQRGGKGVHVFTGTPITNTLTEIYHQMRYVMDDVMRQADVNEWDGFFNTFAASVPDVELTAAGDYESVERLSSFVNVAELRRMAGQYMDIVFADDMPEFKPRSTKSGKTADAKDLTEAERDELLNGRTENPIGRPYKKVIHDIAEMDGVQRRILEEVVGYARAFRAASGKDRIAIMREGGPDAPIVFNNVPTRAGLDARLHQIDAPDSPLSKASRAVRNVSRIYKEDPRTTQVIFMDEGYSDASTKAVKNADGEKVGTERVARFNLAKDIRDRLIAEGVPADQIAIVDGPVSKEKRAEIAQKMNRLEIRVVIGQTQTLGVGVNMQENLRAMHHLDAPWMPGDLEQRNGRGHRQGNKWNTVLEYRYLTEGLDGRRWQVLAIKDRFIKAFLKADANLRVIEGDATDDATSMGADDLAQTLSEAAGDPRIFQAKKLEKDIDRLQRRERIHGEGIADAKRSIRRLEELAPFLKDRIAKLRRDQAKYEAAREAGFTATINGQTYDDRAAAQEAFDAVVVRMKTTDRDRFDYREFKDIGVSVQGFPITAKRMSYDEFYFALEHEGWSGYDTMGKPSIASAEAGLRRFAGMIEGRENEVATNEASIARLKVAVEQPFQQADILKSKQQQLSDLQADMKANPVAPPSWLRQGAPIDALIYVDGEARAVTGHRWTDEGWFVLTEQGPVDYLSAKDDAGMPIYDERKFQPPQVNEGAKLRTGEEGATAEPDAEPEDDAMEMRGLDDDADPDFAFAAEVIQELAQVDDLFQNPRSAATTLEGVFGDIDPSVTPDGILAKDDPRAESSDADRITMFRTNKGKPFYVHETGKEVWIDVSDLGKGDGGSRVYSAVSEYALNTGKVFIGDPEGLSAAALRRRTENMLSTALKHGTTRHIAPHPYQIEGDERLGVPPLAWTEGDDFANVQSLIAVSTASLINRFPQAQDARYDFQTRTFRTGEGKPLSDGALDRWVSDSGRGGAPSIGRRTLKRGILLNTLARAEGGQKPGILEQSLRQQRQLVTGGGLNETFYMRADREPVATLTGDELGEWEDIRQLGKKAEAWYRKNLVGTTVERPDITGPIQFDGRGAKKVGGRKGEDLYRIVPALREILANGDLILSEPDRLNRKEVKAVHTIRATVQLDGRDVSVVATVREKTDGTFHYDLSKDFDGAEVLQGANPANPTVELRSSTSALEGDPGGLNLEFAPSSRKVDPEVQEDDLRALTKALNGMPEMRGLEGRVTVKAVRRLVSHVTGNDILGRFTARDGIEVRAGRGAIGVMRHEIIHALRSEKLWNAPYGLFSGPEWRELVRAARAEPEIVRSVMARYKDQPASVQAEEMVAELYRLWAAQRDQYGTVARSLLKIEGFLRALANALRGRGFVDAGRTMDQIASGRMGGRGPDGSGGGRRRGPDRSADDMEMREALNQWNAQVFDALTGKTPENATLTLGPVPEIMRTLGGAGNRLIMAASKLRKIRVEHPEVTVEALSKLPQLLADPVFVLDNSSEQRTGDRLFVTDMVLSGDTVLVASIKRHGRDSEGGKATIVVTAYGKDRFTSMMKAADERGDVLYVRGEREGSGYKHTGANSLNAPLSGTMLTLRARPKILTPRAVFKRGKPDASSEMEMRALPGTVRDKFAPLVGFRNWRNPSEWISNFLTDRMVSENASILAVVPGRPLFSELGKSLLSAKAYLRTKEDMDALRNDWHAKTADVADEWTRMQSNDPRANDAMMDLMHRSTMTGVDPSKPDDWGKNDNLLRSAKIEVSRLGDRAPDWAKQKVSDEMKRRRTYATVKQMYDALPPEYRAFYVKVKNTYEALANDWDKALEENLKNAARIAMKNAERAHRQALRKIKDDGLTGAERDEAIAKADEDLKKAKARAQASSEGQIKSLRKIFEGQRLKGPYFPLARFGKYFVTVRNDKGEVVSFSRMETEGRQRTHIAEMKEKYPTGKVTFGTIDAKTNMRDQVDPKFVAEVEAIVADSGADADVLDAIWQRYLETLPDESIRTSKIHRKGREGFSRDALRAFAHHMFHGAHQLARLKYGLSLQEHVDDAREEARRSSNPNRMGALVDEMQRRMEWTMNPQGAAWVAAASSLSFVWYLGVSPAAALVNLSQTTIIGPALMKARFQKVSTGKILAELGRAAKDFGKGQGNVWTDTWSAENAETLTAEEKAAMAEGYRRGTIDKTQAYDLASVAESGVEYNPFREKWMRRIGWAFHHAERVNREVTYLANYRLARADGLNHADAVDAASDLTWQIHFSYQNSDRARIMQRDWPKFFLQFRQFSVNMLYRLFRDAHQSLNGATAAERREARTHLIGISLSMMAHAGIKGVWGYGLIMGLLALFFPGDSDDLEDWMQDALLMEGDNPGVAAWNFAMGAALNGIPGQVTGSSLVERIGMPNLWFREPNRDLEGTDLLQHYVNETLGPTVGIMFSLARGAQYVTDGEVVRGVEAMTPKFVRDVIKSGRFAVEGVQTMNDDAILESVNPWELLLQANGFTPARVAERYDMNNRLKNREKEILDERKSLHRAAGDAIKAGGPIPEKVLADIRDFNARFPEYPITGDTIRQSFQGRMRASERNEYGVSLNPKLNDRLREALPAPLYN